MHYKLESLQKTGSFKARGVSNTLLLNSQRTGSNGVITYSTGNHGRAVAMIGRDLGIPVCICISKHVPAVKREALRQAGAQVIVQGNSQDDAAALAARLADERGMILIDPINDPAIIAGHGTLALELLDECRQLDAVLVPVSGGALISGVALAIKAVSPAIKVIGVSIECGAAMHASLAAGRPTEVEEVPSLADSLQGGIGLDNRFTFSMVQRLVDEVIPISEDAIARAMTFVFAHDHLVLEGAAVVGIAALLQGKISSSLHNVVVVATGASVSATLLADLLERYGDSIVG